MLRATSNQHIINISFNTLYKLVFWYITHLDSHPPRLYTVELARLVLGYEHDLPLATKPWCENTTHSYARRPPYEKEKKITKKGVQ